MQPGFAHAESTGPQPATWRYYSMSFGLRSLWEIGTVRHPRFDEMTIEDLLDQKGSQGWELVAVAMMPQSAPEPGGPTINILYTFKQLF